MLAAQSDPDEKAVIALYHRTIRTRHRRTKRCRCGLSVVNAIYEHFRCK